MVRPIPELYTSQIVTDLVKMGSNLQPIASSSTWKGRAVGAGESFIRKFNQIIDLFKTGKWGVEKQAMVKLTKTLHQITGMTDKVSKDLASRSPGLIETDRAMRGQLVDRLRMMNEILSIAIVKSEKPEQYEGLKKEFQEAINKNNRIIEEENKIIPNIQSAGTAGQAAAVRGREKLTEKRAAELNQTERPEAGKISEQTKRSLDEKLRRKHEVEVPYGMSRTEGFKKTEASPEEGLQHPTKSRPAGPAGRRQPTKKPKAAGEV